MNVWKSLPDAKEHLAVLHYECIARVNELSESTGIQIPDEIASLATEMAFRFAQLLVTDLEAFARHAKRSTITVDDVRLFVRRNPSLCKFIEEQSARFDDANQPEDAATSCGSSSAPKKSKKAQQTIHTSISGRKPIDRQSLMYDSDASNEPATPAYAACNLSPKANERVNAPTKDNLTIMLSAAKPSLEDHSETASNPQLSPKKMKDQEIDCDNGLTTESVAIVTPPAVSMPSAEPTQLRGPSAKPTNIRIVPPRISTPRKQHQQELARSPRTITEAPKTEAEQVPANASAVMLSTSLFEDAEFSDLFDKFD